MPFQFFLDLKINFLKLCLLFLQLLLRLDDLRIVAGYQSSQFLDVFGNLFVLAFKVELFLSHLVFLLGF